MATKYSIQIGDDYTSFDTYEAALNYFRDSTLPYTQAYVHSFNERADGYYTYFTTVLVDKPS
jgi:viroplasmin and RNaseH domain-containing protein